MPFLVGAGQHVQLNECTGFLRTFPRRGLFAGAQAHDGVPHAQRLTGLHAQIPGFAISFVKQADHTDTGVHGRAFHGAAGGNGVARDLHGRAFISLRKLVTLVAAGKRQRQQYGQDSARRAANHGASGLHAS